MRRLALMLVLSVITVVCFPVSVKSQDSFDMDFMAIFDEEEFLSNREMPAPPPKPSPQPPLLDLSPPPPEPPHNNSLLLRQPIQRLMLKRGKWLPISRDTTLVIAELRSPGHAGGNYHSLITVVDSETHKRLTKVLHFVSDDAAYQVLNGQQTNILLILAHGAGQCDWFRDNSAVVVFGQDSISHRPALGDLDPSRYLLVLEEHEAMLYTFVVVPPKDPPESICVDRAWRKSRAIWRKESERFEFSTEDMIPSWHY